VADLFLPVIFLGTASDSFLRPAASRLLLSRFLPKIARSLPECSRSPLAEPQDTTAPGSIQRFLLVKLQRWPEVRTEQRCEYCLKERMGRSRNLDTV
jgi:hypothetical protein